MSASRIRLFSFAAALALGVVLASASEVALASAQRTFVASTGNDANAANNCSLVLPCRSFATALTQTLASGEIIVLDSAGYAPVTIDRSVSIIAPDGIYAGITAFSGDAVDITAFNLRVVLRGLTINGLGGVNGIAVLVGESDISVDRVRITGFSGAGIEANAGALASTRLYVRDSIVTANATGIDVGATSSFIDDANGAIEVLLDRVQVRENTFYGVGISKGVRIHIRDSVIETNTVAGIGAGDENVSNGPTMSLTIERSAIRRNGLGVFVSIGVLTPFSPFQVTLSEAAVTDNAGAGVDVTCKPSATGIITVAESVITGNAGAGVSGTGAGCALNVSHNVIAGNSGTSMVNVSAGSFASFGDNRVRGNNPDTPSGTITPVAPR
jgi:hypothetical protein